LVGFSFNKYKDASILTSTTSATEHYDQLKRDWELEQTVSVLFSNALGAIIGNLFNISLVGFLLLDVYSDSWLPVWFSIGLLLNGFRLLLWFR
jgi:cation transporter-like permease